MISVSLVQDKETLKITDRNLDHRLRTHSFIQHRKIKHENHNNEQE